MPAQPGNNLLFPFYFTKAGVLTDPSPAPTIVYAKYPDQTDFVSPSLTHVSTGYYEYTLPGVNVTQIGNYQMLISTTDTSLDSSRILDSVDVSDPLSYAVPDSYAVGTAGNDIAAILSRVNAITTEPITVISPVSPDNVISIIIPDTYSASTLVLPFPNQSGVPIPSDATISLMVRTNGQLLSFPGIRIDANNAQVQLSSVQVAEFSVGRGQQYHCQMTFADGITVFTVNKGFFNVTEV